VLALESTHTEMLVLGTIVLLLGVAFFSLAQFWPAASPNPEPSTVRSEPEITGPAVPIARTISWPLAIDPDAGMLTESERRYVIEGLGIVGDRWSAEILARAFDEEDGELRVAAIEALAMCEAGDIASTLERAYASYVVAERYAAVDGALRHGDVALLERALRDTDGTVALAAAYGLQRAKRDDVIESALDGRDDARATEIRRVLPILA
jgi:hypothetical protein